MSLIIRPYEPTDLDAYLRLLNQGNPHPTTPPQLQERWALRVAQGLFSHRLVAERDGQVVAYGVLEEDEYFGRPGWLNLGIRVDTDLRRQGLGQALHDALGPEVVRRQLQGLEAYVLDTEPDARAWAERRGFGLYAHRFASELDLVRFEPALFAGAVERVEASGIRFLSLSEVADPDKGQRFFELYARLVDDAPDMAGIPSTTWEWFRVNIWENRSVRPEGVILALDGERWIGMTVTKDRPGGRLYTDFTGTDPSYRGRGISLALKLLCIEYARRMGYTVMATNNLSINAPMLAVNRRLGYEARPGIWWLRREL